MSLWILDTDHASLFLAGNKSIITQVEKHYNNVAITVVTV
jgi:tRNA(fMet)-specific endonuclease VapC